MWKQHFDLFQRKDLTRLFTTFLGTCWNETVNIVFRDRSGTVATSKMELFVIKVNGFQPSTIITKYSILDVAAVLYAPLVLTIILPFSDLYLALKLKTPSQKILKWSYITLFIFLLGTSLMYVLQHFFAPQSLAPHNVFFCNFFSGWYFPRLVKYGLVCKAGVTINFLVPCFHIITVNTEICYRQWITVITPVTG